MDVFQCLFLEASPRPAGKHRKKSVTFKTTTAMQLQIKHIVRWTFRSAVQRQGTVGRKLWTVCAAQRRGAGAEGSHACANINKSVSLQCCRKYASDTAYSRAFATARDDPEKFWGEAARDIHWFEPWSKSLHVEDPVFPNW